MTTTMSVTFHEQHNECCPGKAVSSSETIITSSPVLWPSTLPLSVAVWNDYKHFCLSTWSDYTSYVIFEHNTFLPVRSQIPIYE